MFQAPLILNQSNLKIVLKYFIIILTILMLVV